MINVTYRGNGYAYIDDPNPEPNQIVTLYAYPDAGETIDDMIATDQHGYFIALDPSRTVQSFQYYSSWGNVQITVIFSGSTPPTPTTVPIWLLFKMRMQNFMNRR
ncbi:MAG: hypothetical protein J5656_06930 [Clostridia bacterium]|nr:hypothetical protein [Clostridia bacterium]